MEQAQNFKAIKRWFMENRPDVSQYELEALMKQDAIILLMAGAFEAGREFQQRNPEAGKFLDMSANYK